MNHIEARIFIRLQADSDATLRQRAVQWIGGLGGRVWVDGGCSACVTFDPLIEEPRRHGVIVEHHHNGKLISVEYLPCGFRGYAKT